MPKKKISGYFVLKRYFFCAIKLISSLGLILVIRFCLCEELSDAEKSVPVGWHLSESI